MAERAASLTQRLLAFSRRQPLVPKPTDVARLLATEQGKPITECYTMEVVPTIDALEGYVTEAVMLQSSRLVPLGGAHRLAPNNPVFVVSGVLA